MGKELSQLENTQTVVLQQTDGKKIYLDLNVSTDTTAIESFKQASLVSEKAFEKSTDISNASFDYATGVAVCLAMSATLLAYLFGARSFKLTEMSFKVVSSDIKESAQTHLLTSQLMMENQIKVLKVQKRNELNDEIRSKITTYLSKFSSLRQKILMEYSFPYGSSIPLKESSESCSDKVRNHYLYKEINDSYSHLISLTINISLLINPYEENAKCLLDKMDALNGGILDVLPELFFKEQNKVEELLNELLNIKLSVHKYSVLVVGES